MADELTKEKIFLSISTVLVYLVLYFYVCFGYSVRIFALGISNYATI